MCPRGLFLFFLLMFFFYNFILLWNSFPFSVKFVRNIFTEPVRVGLRRPARPASLYRIIPGLFAASCELLDVPPFGVYELLLFFFSKTRIIFYLHLNLFSPLCHELFHASSWAWNSSWRVETQLVSREELKEKNTI